MQTGRTFESFYRTEWASVVRAVGFSLGDRDLAQECVDEVMTRAYERGSVSGRGQGHGEELAAPRAAAPRAGSGRPRGVSPAGLQATMAMVSTRRLIIAAAICGVAILMAFAVQVWLVL
jgi:hypothetical protein